MVRHYHWNGNNILAELLQDKIIWKAIEIKKKTVIYCSGHTEIITLFPLSQNSNFEQIILLEHMHFDYNISWICYKLWVTFKTQLTFLGIFCRP